VRASGCNIPSTQPLLTGSIDVPLVEMRFIASLPHRGRTSKNVPVKMYRTDMRNAWAVLGGGSLGRRAGETLVAAVLALRLIGGPQASRLWLRLNRQGTWLEQAAY
jgi:hypothetical protein